MDYIPVDEPEPVATSVDGETEGVEPSRAALVASAVEREMRRLLAEHDAATLGRRGAADDLDGLVQWTAAHAEVED